MTRIIILALFLLCLGAPARAQQMQASSAQTPDQHRPIVILVPGPRGLELEHAEDCHLDYPLVLAGEAEVDVLREHVQAQDLKIEILVGELLELREQLRIVEDYCRRIEAERRARKDGESCAK